LHGRHGHLRSWADTWLAPWFDSWHVTGALPAVHCPALLLQGVDDEYATPDHLAEIASRLAGPVHAELLDGCGHAPHHEAPGVVISLVARWISSWSPRPRQRLGAEGSERP
jgi:pimeloyl-ACP methyl ester carboxylesterase